MNVQRMFFQRVTFSPHSVEHLLPREDSTWSLNKLKENLKFLWSQLDSLPTDHDFMSIKIHPDISGTVVPMSLFRRRNGPPQNRAHTGNELAWGLI